MEKIRIFIIEDSKFYQLYLKKIIEEDEQLEVAGFASTAKEALEKIAQINSEIITLDLHLPDVNGLEFLQKLEKQYHVPIIVITSLSALGEESLKFGARDFIEKLKDNEKNSIAQFGLLLRLKIKMLTKTSAPKKEITIEKIEKKEEPVKNKQLHPERAIKSSLLQDNIELIAIGASLGGTEATLRILKELPEDMPGIVVVQHMPEEFTAAYAARLNKNCKLEVKEAKNGDQVKPGLVLLAKGGEQMRVCKSKSGYHIRCTKEEKYNGFCPSVDVLFESVAIAAGKKAIGVILTGMGRDGALGLLKMHKSGAYTIGQNKETCAVFGMPDAASKAGGVDLLLSPAEIVEQLKKKTKKG